MPEQLTGQELIDALHRGRQKFPEKIDVNMWGQFGQACALGAIAAGLGLTPNNLEDGEAVEHVYELLESKGVPTSRIYSTNDDSFQHGVMVRDPDVAVILYIKERYGIND